MVYRVWAALLIGLCAVLGASPAAAQFTNTNAGPIGNQQICPGGNNNGDAATNPNGYLTRSINVTNTPGAAGAISVGLIADHTYRGDIRMDMRKQGGNWVTIFGPSGTPQDDYNILIADGHAEAINTGSAAGNHNVAAAPYQFDVNAGGSLAAFVSTPANGTWQFRFCDNDYRDNGTIQRIEIAFDRPEDLSMLAEVDDAFPPYGGDATATFTVTNFSTLTATNVIVNVGVQGNANNVTANPGSGTFSGTTWTIPSLSSGATATLAITAELGTTPVNFTATIASSNLNDVEPSNDTDSVTATPQPPSTLVPLSCSIGEVYTMAWSLSGDNAWPSPTGTALSNSYKFEDTDPGTDDIDLTLTMSRPDGSSPATYLAGAVSQPSPRTRAGWTTSQFPNSAASLYVGLNFPGQGAQDKVHMTMDLGLPAEGVESFQFTISDIDQGTYYDRITVFGYAYGQLVGTPALTPQSGVIVSGRSGYTKQTGNQPATSAAGNLTVTFNEPVDQIVFVYDNTPDAAADPGTQAIALQDISICRRLLPDIEATKSVSVYDPGNLGLFMTPGNEVEYALSVVNKGPVNGGTAEGDAEGIVLTDILPPTLTYVSASTSGFNGGSIVTEPAANTDCGATACEVTFQGGGLDVDETGTLTIRALIK